MHFTFIAKKNANRARVCGFARVCAVDDFLAMGVQGGTPCLKLFSVFGAIARAISTLAPTVESLGLGVTLVPRAKVFAAGGSGGARGNAPPGMRAKRAVFTR